MITKKRILITGAGGFIGNHLSQHLSSLDNHITGTIITGQTNLSLNKSIQCEITDYNDVKKLANYKFDHIFHLAGIANIKTSIKNPQEDFEVNAKGTLNMLEAFRDSSIESFNFISTISVLDSLNLLPLDEDAKYGPTTPYAASKMSAESYCRVYNKCFYMPTRIIRFTNVYGPGSKNLVIFDLIRKLLKNSRSLEIYGNGEQIRDFLYVKDAVCGLEIIAEHGLNGNIYHIGSGEPTSILSLAQIIIATMNLTDTEIITTNDNYSGEFLKWYANTDKVKKHGFEPKIKLIEGLEKTINWIEKL